MINVVKLRDKAPLITIVLVLLIGTITSLVIFFKNYKIVKIDNESIVKERVVKVKEPLISNNKCKDNTETKKDIKINIDVEKIIEKSKPNVYNVRIINPVKVDKVIKDDNLKTATKTITELNDLFEELK